MKTLYLFRHGLTAAIKERRTYGDDLLSAEILPEGKPVIERIGMYLKAVPKSKNYSSEFRRCRQTVEIIENISAKEFIFDKRLNEFQTGIPETQVQFLARMDSFYLDIQLVSEDDIIICTHGAVIAAILNLSRFGTAEFVEPYYPDPGILLIVRGEEIKQIDFN